MSANYDWEVVADLLDAETPFAWRRSADLTEAYEVFRVYDDGRALFTHADPAVVQKEFRRLETEWRIDRLKEVPNLLNTPETQHAE